MPEYYSAEFIRDVNANNAREEINTKVYELGHSVMDMLKDREMLTLSAVEVVNLRGVGYRWARMTHSPHLEITGAHIIPTSTWCLRRMDYVPLTTVVDSPEAASALPPDEWTEDVARLGVCMVDDRGAEHLYALSEDGRLRLAYVDGFLERPTKPTEILLADREVEYAVDRIAEAYTT